MCDDNGGIVGEQQPNALPPQQIVQLFGCLETGGLGAFIYAVVAAGWLSILGDRALFGALLLTWAILLLILRSRGRGIEPAQK